MIQQPNQDDRTRFYVWTMLLVHALIVLLAFITFSLADWIAGEETESWLNRVEIASAALAVLLSVGVMLFVARADLTKRLPKWPAVLAFCGHIVLMVALYVPIYAYLGYECGGVRSQSWLTHSYFSIVTFTTLGYGDCQPVGVTRLFAASQALLSYLFVALFLGLIARQPAGDKSGGD